MNPHTGRLNWTIGICCLALAGVTGGCDAIGDHDEQVGERGAPTTAELAAAESVDLAPLVSLDLGNGSAVDYFEAEPGSILIVETGPRTNTPALSRLDPGITDAADVYRALAPGQPVPVALREAAARAVPREVIVEDGVEDLGADRPERSAGLWNNWFSEEFCTIPGSEFSFCLLDQTVSASRSYADAFHMRSAALGNYGTVRFTFYRYRWYDGWKLLANQNVDAGWYVWYQFTEGGIDDPDLWTGVLDVAAGEQYDFGGTGIW